LEALELVVLDVQLHSRAAVTAVGRPTYTVATATAVAKQLFATVELSSGAYYCILPVSILAFNHPLRLRKNPYLISPCRRLGSRFIFLTDCGKNLIWMVRKEVVDHIRLWSDELATTDLSHKLNHRTFHLSMLLDHTKLALKPTLTDNFKPIDQFP
jgi:hypothetical protein